MCVRVYEYLIAINDHQSAIEIVAIEGGAMIFILFTVKKTTTTINEYNKHKRDTILLQQRSFDLILI